MVPPGPSKERSHGGETTQRAGCSTKVECECEASEGLRVDSRIRARYTSWQPRTWTPYCVLSGTAATCKSRPSHVKTAGKIFAIDCRAKRRTPFNRVWSGSGGSAAPRRRLSVEVPWERASRRTRRRAWPLEHPSHVRAIDGSGWPALIRRIVEGVSSSLMMTVRYLLISISRIGNMEPRSSKTQRGNSRYARCRHALNH